MNTQTLTNIKNRFNLTDADIVSVCMYVVTSNRMYSWKRGKGADSQANSNSQGVLSGNYFKAEHMQDAIREFKRHSQIDFSLSQKNADSTQTDNSQPENNNEIEFKQGMSREESVTMLNKMLKTMRDPKQRADIAIKINNLLEFKSDTKDGNTPHIFLPQRCESCKYKKQIDELETSK